MAAGQCRLHRRHYHRSADIDWTRLFSELASAPAEASANIASPTRGLVTNQPIAVKTISIAPAQPPEVAARNATDIAVAKAQLARELTEPESGTAAVRKPRMQEANADPVSRVLEDENPGAAPSDRGRPSEPKSSRALSMRQRRNR